MLLPHRKVCFVAGPSSTPSPKEGSTGMSSTELSYWCGRAGVDLTAVLSPVALAGSGQPDVTEEDAILKVHTICDNGNIGYRLFTHGFLAPNRAKLGTLPHALDVNTFIANVHKRHFVKSRPQKAEKGDGRDYSLSTLGIFSNFTAGFEIWRGNTAPVRSPAIPSWSPWSCP